MYIHRNFDVELDGKSYFTANIVDLQAYDQDEQQWDYDMTIVFNESNPIGPPEVVGYIYGQFDSEEELIKWLKRLQNDNSKTTT